MKFQGAVIKEQGVTFAVVIVKKQLVDSRVKGSEVIESLSPCFSGIPIVLMAQDARGRAHYLGRRDIVNFLTNIHVSQIPWKEYTVN